MRVRRSISPIAVTAVVGLLAVLHLLRLPVGAAPSFVVTPGTEVPTPTATSTATSVPPTATSVPPTATPAPPSATPVPLTATPVPPSATPAPTWVDLQINTAVDNPTPNKDETVRLNVALGNRGNAQAQDVVVQIDIPPGLEFLGLDGWNGDWSREGNRLFIWVRTVDAYAALNFAILARATGGGSLSFTTAVTTSNSSDPIVDNSSVQTLSVNPLPAVPAEKAPLPETDLGPHVNPLLLAAATLLLLLIRFLTRLGGLRERLRRPPR